MGKHSDNILIFIYLETFTAYNMNVKLMEIYVHLDSIVGVTKQAVKLFSIMDPDGPGGGGNFHKKGTEVLVGNFWKETLRGTKCFCFLVFFYP